MSKRSGVQKIWIVRADDFDESAKSARMLIAGNTPARESDPAWSPDGKTLAFIQNGNLWQINVDGSDEHALTTFADQPYQSVRWQPGGQLLALAFNLYQQRIELYDSATGEIRQLTKGGKESQPAWLNAQTVLYTAPGGPDLPDAIWQVNVDGSGQSILGGSAQPGVEDTQANASVAGSATALVSTRSGTRDIWLQAMLQVSHFTVDPASGAAPGRPFHISYTLPMDSDVTVQVLRPDGSLAQMLLDLARQPKGPQDLSWNGADSKDQPLAAGLYLAKLIVKPVSGGGPLERFITMRVFDPASIGSLRLQINQWAGQPFQKFNGSVGIYQSGTRLHTIAQANGNREVTFDLPAGKYDLVVTFGRLRREVNGITIDPGKTLAQDVDLGLGGLNVAILAAPDQPIAGSALDFVLPPGSYDIRSQFQGVHQVSYAVQVTTGQVAKREINLGSGVLRLNVLSSANKGLDRQFIVEAFSPQDH